MSELEGLYQEVILDHSRRPRNFHSMKDADRHADGYNPLCGDRFTVYLKLQDDRITEISFQGTGCAISTASASILTEILKGKTRAQADALFDTFHDLVTGKTSAEGETPALGKLAAFSGVCEFPVRVKCATLVWHTLRSALNGDKRTATTE
ncbi:MAG TPA: SUF system NifU family Fe-S cluster assembly protein [Candidatus Sulfotelmatobacter sp.]|nr:SUF system NifU family Fe-S cluster assembly protein [Candidatus Sulfotelmatobacter sp.]